MPTMSRRRLCFLAAGILTLLTAAAATLIFTVPDLRWLVLGFSARDYPTLHASGGWQRYGFPSALPSGATGVRILAPASLPSFLPAPDQYVEVRFLLPAADAASLLLQAQRVSAATAFPASLPASDHLLGSLQTSSNPASQAMTSCLLTNPSGSDISGVSVNTATGEVIFWIFEQ